MTAKTYKVAESLAHPMRLTDIGALVHRAHSELGTAMMHYNSLGRAKLYSHLGEAVSMLQRAAREEEKNV